MRLDNLSRKLRDQGAVLKAIAMHHRPFTLSRTERVASLATAIGVTLGMVLLVLAAQVERDSTAPGSARADELTVERIAYVTPPPLTLTAASPVLRSPPRRVRTVNAAPSREPVGAPPRDSASLAPEAAAPLPIAGAAIPDSASSGAANMTSSKAARWTAGAPVASAKVGFSHGPVEGVAPPPFKPLPPTQAEIDAKWRDQAFEVAAARGAGVPVRMTTSAGGISVPLPFGGPSKKQRERDRAIEAQLKVLRALRQQRIDSVVASRKRRLADSLARVADSLRSPW
jgi:hypothetical protein